MAGRRVDFIHDRLNHDHPDFRSPARRLSLTRRIRSTARIQGFSPRPANDGTNNKLAIMSRQTGLSNGFTVNNSLTNSAGAAVAFAAGQSPSTGNSQNAVNANFTVNGLSIVSATNTPANAIPGATLTLSKVGETTITVAPDYSGVQTALNSLVSQYNSLQQFVTQQTANGQPLIWRSRYPPADEGHPQRNHGRELRSNGGQYTYLAEVGLQFDQSGNLTLDQNSLSTALNSNPQDLEKLFGGSSGTNGAMNGLLANIDNDDATAGLILSTQNADKITSQQLDGRYRRPANEPEQRENRTNEKVCRSRSSNDLNAGILSVALADRQHSVPIRRDRTVRGL